MSRTSRRSARAAAVVATGAALALTLTPPAGAAAPVERIPLAAGSQPEGIASEGTTYWAGARLDGAVYTGDLRTGTRRLLVPGRPDTAARGMQLDPATRTLWVAGDVRLDPEGTSTRSTISAYDADTGALRRRVVVPGQRFLNDVQVVGDRVFVTDSLSRQLVVVGANGFRLLPMTGEWEQPAGFGANGIRLLPSGALLVTSSSTGALFSVDPTTGVARQVRLTGPALKSGDGLVVRGSTVYVVYGFATNDEIAVVELAADGLSGRVTGALTDPDLHRPTTAVLAAGALYAVNGRFGVPPTPRTEYGVVRVALR